ncbi:hypothetical protein GLOIN_2v1788498 [Rhizophagus irregularis DAOM 181602=DAOM 197198]|nr:hypothetical protein GLOIN_2v1788498 [Rhizophagus irregularis DAOM 181602=DAOM 197198]
MGVAFCVNNESALSVQANLSLWPLSTHAELVAIFLIPIEYNLRKFIKTLMNTRVAAEWSMLKTNDYEIPIAWNITWNLINKYKGFNYISVKKHWHLIFIIKLFAKLLPIGIFYYSENQVFTKILFAPDAMLIKKKTDIIL